MFTHILHKTKLVSDMLQSPSLGLSATAQIIDAIQQELKNERSEKARHSIWEKAVAMSQTHNIEVSPAKQRIHNLPRHLKDAAVLETAVLREVCKHEEQEGYKNTLYYPVMDRLLTEIESRFDDATKSLFHSLSSLDPSSPKFLQQDQLETMAGKCNVDLEFLDVELRQAKRLVKCKRTDGVKIANIVDLTAFFVPFKDAFPGLYKMLIIAHVLPPTSASCERSFSSLRHIKNYLGNSMCDHKLSGVSVIGIHQGRAKNVGMERLVDIFARKHNNRMMQMY
ncbi:zinc finger MYM-type protein 1-like [Macrobrachium rosenbergii]|uniref:zinc finger MYM-type protein 1-like n=1 Tax=Macrobrachium rosenbergii TaxID=79674 RepID=UPI0034D6C608